jgi:predicted  nucleic acid-binding Zn-ribbon protein
MSTPFQFGACANFSFTAPPSTQQQLDQANMSLAQARAANGDLGAKLAQAEANSKQSRLAEKIARGALVGFRSLLDIKLSKAKMDLLDSPEAKAAIDKAAEQRTSKLEADHDLDLLKHHEETDALKHNLSEQRDRLKRVQDELRNNKAHLEEKTKEADTLKNQLDTSFRHAHTLEKDLEHEKAAAAESASILDAAYADLNHATDKYLVISKAKDVIELQQTDTQLQLDDLRAQWEEDQAKIEELEEHVQALHKLEETISGLQSDLDSLHETIADHERTLIVKDERIAHLENQYQKERQRTLNAADAAAATAAASPTDEPPQTFTGLAESLADELEAASDDAEFEYEHLEHLELSDVTAIADLAPIEPIYHPWLVHVTEAASVIPIVPAIPKLSTDINEAANVTPIDHQVTTTSASAQTDTQRLTVGLLNSATLDIAPIAPVDIATTTTSTQTDTPRVETPSLTTVLIDPTTLDISPIAPVETPTTTTSTQTDALKLTTNIINTAAIAVSPVNAPQKQTPTTPLNCNIVPVTATFEMSPLKAYPHNKTTSEANHTTELAAPPSSPVHISTKPHKINWLQWLSSVLVLVLAYYCFFMYMELEAWRTVNGVGFGNGKGGPHTRSGAYGNGRHLFGVFPVAMDVNSLWMPEVVTKYAAVAITRFEDWAGISYVPHY